MRPAYCFLLAMMLFSSVSAQEPTAAEIKKYKIKKITQSEQSSDGLSSNITWYYDQHGNDTARYNDAVRNTYKVIVYDSKQRIQTITHYSDKAAITETTIYTYKPDGSFTSRNTDTQFGLVNIENYNAKGLLTSLTIPDGSVHHFVYNNRGQLIKSYSVPRNGGTKFTRTYVYNAKGQMITERSVSNYPSTSTYEYGEKGLLTKTTIVSGGEGEEKTTTVFTYTYGY
jgi:YD repeat-containing protein